MSINSLVALNAHDPRAYLPLRWGSYAAFLVITLVAVAVAYLKRVNGPNGVAPRDRSSFPWAEGVSALVAAAAWGLAMPYSPLNVQLNGVVRTLAVSAIVIGTGAVLSLFLAPTLRSATKSAGE